MSLRLRCERRLEIETFAVQEGCHRISHARKSEDSSDSAKKM